MVTNGSGFRLFFKAQVLHVFQSFGYLKVFKKSVFGKYLIVSVEYFCKTVSFCAQYSPILQFLSWWLEIPVSPAVNINKSHSKLTQLTSLKIIQRPDRSDKGNMENWHIFLVYIHSPQSVLYLSFLVKNPDVIYRTSRGPAVINEEDNNWSRTTFASEKRRFSQK